MKKFAEKKFVLITGASSGLGKATALRLAQEGYSVFAGVRKAEDKATLDAMNPNIKAIFLDVTNDESVDCAFETIQETTDKIYALVNNAGIALGGPIEFLPVDMLKKQFEINVFGAIRVAQKFLPMMSEGDNRIVNISSMASYGVFPFVSPYCASKRALDMFFNSLLVENKNSNLKIISIKPGVVATPIWNKSVDECEKSLEHLSQEAKDKYEKELLLLAENARKNADKGLKPDDIAELVSKVLFVEKPKLSYNIGKDSHFARLLSFLPQGWTNFLIKTVLKKRVA